jgi:alpha-galactosidase
VLENGRQAVRWGYELVKQDFLTYDLLGRWGNEMGAQCTLPGWSFNDRSVTNAEIILDLYKDIRTSCGNNTMLTGCNTMCHLGQGYFDIQRVGDDTSGKIWDRTRYMGVNALAFRLPQHKAFSILDPDCVGLRPEIPWELNRQWMDVVARTGTALFVSPAVDERTSEHSQAIREAFQITAAGGDGAYPDDCLRESTPRLWKSGRSKLRYDWIAKDGAAPFPV